ncbi:Probable arginine--tRNA ligase, cytoplasmic [Strongyloides ratti]|uniref:Probable arginine--tRNA ligase, cytoplasmic n=1 Tax=Strongyloides ratti TaxID=34506 RepID=A0A090LIQ9_STRRB|nr:Probable arginine--tRNA ligase, cytoplasmic [Strongyloides ratti]CEF68018.1 Probable arginine--tRNA ligase, cytoplasmic [Strongyloides ratti]
MSKPTHKPDEEQRALERHFEKSFDKVQKLQKLLKDINEQNFSEELLDSCPKLKEAITDIEKMKYRISILKRSIENQKNENAKKVKSNGKASEPKKEVKTPQKSGKNKEYVNVLNYGDSIVGQLKAIFTDALKKAYPSIEDKIILVETNNPKYGDYQLNNALKICGILKASGVKTTPKDVATKIASLISKSDLIEELDISPAGFINIHLCKKFIGQKIGNIFDHGIVLPVLEKKRVIVDFSSPNIAKEMHVGHLRSTIIGDSISRLLEYVGYDVLRLNHIGDWGTQFGMLIAHLQDKFPNFLNETPPISDLQAFYKESKKRFDEDETFKARAYECVVKLQNFDEEFVKAWKLICDVSRKNFENIYERLDVNLVERGESFYQNLMINVVKEFENSGVVKVEEGRKVFFPTNCSVPLTIVKSDGGFTYDTSDMAAIRQRIFDEKADWILYVIDAGQNLHMETIFAAARDLKWYDEEKQRIEHIAFGLVLGEDKKKFKTRSGETVKLVDLMDEGLKRSGDKLVEKERDKVLSKEELEAAQKAVAYGCIKYADLSHNRCHDYVFSFDRMLDDKGNTAVYLLYAYARIRSIARNAGVQNSTLTEYIKNLKNNAIPLDHPAEFKLAKHILKFCDTILVALDTFLLHQICDYVYGLATTFHDFYNECYVIQKDKDGTVKLFENRLVLCEVTADIMCACFNILGIKAVNRMRFSICIEC